MLSTKVALLAEGVDRNLMDDGRLPTEAEVALLAEGVDRNLGDDEIMVNLAKSPSSRRAWIEIKSVYDVRCNHVVALLAEGVDRNHYP